MSDYISRQDAIDALNRLCPYPGEWSVNGLELCKDAIANLPSIDAVPVIRCKDCKQCRKTILFGHLATVCDYWIKLTDDDGYCNHAERKES